MNFVIILERAQLDPGDDPHTETLACRFRCRNTINGVVIREGDGRQAAAVCRFDHFLRREYAVRRSRVSVQIDECRPLRARIRAHRS